MTDKLADVVSPEFNAIFRVLSLLLDGAVKQSGELDFYVRNLRRMADEDSDPFTVEFLNGIASGLERGHTGGAAPSLSVIDGGRRDES